MSGVENIGGIATPRDITVSDARWSSQPGAKRVDDLPPPRGPLPLDGGIPRLPTPAGFDPSVLISKILAMQAKMSDEETQSSVETVKFSGRMRKSLNEEIIRATQEATELGAEGEDSGKAMRILGWIGVALAVAGAALTGGILAPAAAAIAVTMLTLTETGVMEKMTEAVAESLVNDHGMDPAEAQAVAGYIVMGFCAALSLATAGTGIAASASTIAQRVPGLVALAAKNSERLGRIASQAMYVGRGAQGATGLAQGISQVHTSVVGFQANERQGESLELNASVARYKKVEDDELEHIELVLQAMSNMYARVGSIMENYISSSMSLARQTAV